MKARVRQCPPPGTSQRRHLAWAGLAALVACATATREDLPSGGDDPGSGGSSGASGSGGSGNPSGGVGASGGVTPMGGNGASGGTSGKGGSDATGGTSGKGGSDATGGTSGSAGSGAGKGGTNPFGGAGGMSGSAGKGGTAGQGGAGGAGGGAAGAGGAGGSGGGPVVPPTGECAMNPTLELRYKVNQTGDSIAFDLRLTNTGAAPISANQIEFQYYISQEESAWQDRVLDVYAIQSTNYMDLKTTGTITVDALMPVLGMQTHVVRIRQTGGALLPPGMSSYLNVTARLQPNPSMPNQVQSNDFSYSATHTMLAAWDHVAVFVNGMLAWGCTPEA